MSQASETTTGDIAIVSMAGRFPSASCCEQLWQAIVAGRELISTYNPIPPQHIEGYGGIYVPRGAFIHAPELFDYKHFRYTPREAARMDPQQRQALEVCYEALQRAGYARGREVGQCGVFIGTRHSTWHERHTQEAITSNADKLLALGGQATDALATRVAYKLDCTGPATNVMNFCSGSLVAVHLACLSLIQGDCDMALAGGVCIRYPAHVGYFYHEGGILSRQGQVRAFDEYADGTLFSDAVAFVALRRLADALRDGNPLLAIIKASAINNDGIDKAGYVAPSVSGQKTRDPPCLTTCTAAS